MPNFMLLRLQTSEISARKHTYKQTDNDFLSIFKKSQKKNYSTKKVKFDIKMRGKSLKMYILNLVEIRWKLRILWRKFKKERFDPKIEFEVEIQNSASTRSPACHSRCFMQNFVLLRFQSSEISARKQTNKQTNKQTYRQCPLYV